MEVSGGRKRVECSSSRHALCQAPCPATQQSCSALISLGLHCQSRAKNTLGDVRVSSSCKHTCVIEVVLLVQGHPWAAPATQLLPFLLWMGVLAQSVSFCLDSSNFLPLSLWETKKNKITSFDSVLSSSQSNCFCTWLLADNDEVAKLYLKTLEKKKKNKFLHCRWFA